MTTMLQTFSFSGDTEETGEFEGLLAASLVRGAKTRMPEASRRQRRMTRRRRFS